MRARNERGSVSVVAAAILLATMVVTLGAADLARVLIAASRAQTAADAGALGAAQSLAFPGEIAPASVAADLAARNGGRMLVCDCEPGTLEARVQVEVSVGRLFLSPDDLVVGARARAIVELPPP
jgi:secretion/DNA translocation related TadE-like protein